MEQSLPQFCERFLELYQNKTPMVVVTLTDMVGHAPQDVGARMIVGTDEIYFGTVGGGKLEKRCIDLSREFLTSKIPIKNQSHQWNLPRDIGMTCGGEVTLYFETYKPEETWKIAIFGAGHISQELVPILLKLNCELTVVDPRPEWLSRLPHSPRLKKIQEENMPLVLETLDSNTFVAIVTMGHATDYPLVKLALEKHHFPYLGVIGSKVKRIKMNADLIASGIPEKLAKEGFYLPMGEDFGRNTPAEIALSIVAQLLKTRDQLFNP